MKIGYKLTKGYQNLAIASVIVASALCTEAQAAPPMATSPYSVSVFAGPPVAAGLTTLTNPDSITTANGNIYFVYANATNAYGTGGVSTFVEYSPTGIVLRTFDVTGKADGLKYNPFDHKLWALRNEDSNPALTLIDPKSGVKTDYTYAQLSVPERVRELTKLKRLSLIRNPIESVPDIGGLALDWETYTSKTSNT